VTVAECAAVELQAYAEPLTQPLVDDAHGFIYFRTRSGSAAAIAKRLAGSEAICPRGSAHLWRRSGQTRERRAMPRG
jgi:hypothetical protein